VEPVTCSSPSMTRERLRQTCWPRNTCGSNRSTHRQEQPGQDREPSGAGDLDPNISVEVTLSREIMESPAGRSGRKTMLRRIAWVGADGAGKAHDRRAEDQMETAGRRDKHGRGRRRDSLKEDSKGHKGMLMPIFVRTMKNIG